MTKDRVRGIEISVAEVSPKTRWIFVEIESMSGLRGVGEATLNGREDAVLAAVQKLAPVILDLAEASPGLLPANTPLPVLADAAAFSAVDQALWDIAAQRGDVRLADALGGIRRDMIPLYANINRRTLDRSPGGFAASARDAIAAGHEAIKIAPFDEATAEARSAGNLSAALAPGLDRIAAVRSAIGPERRLMVDCHWRLDESAAVAVIAAAAASKLHWFECPLPEIAAHLPALHRLRRVANQHGMRLAGCEENIRREGFAPFLEAEVYDVMMPDVKYAGGLMEMLALANVMAKSGVEFSPHNPSGPICHAASLHVAAAAAGLTMLECQFDETPWFNKLQAVPLPARVGGNAALPSAGGLGTALDHGALDQCRRSRWRAP
jgi:galactonate dehydratase